MNNNGHDILVENDKTRLVVRALLAVREEARSYRTMRDTELSERVLLRTASE